MKKRALISLLLACSMAFGTAAMAGCDIIGGTDNGGNTQEQPDTVKVTGVSITDTSIELTEGGSKTLTAKILPENAANKKVGWKSSSPTVASVDDNGKVTALKAGTTVITVTTEDGGKTAICTVKVNAKSGGSTTNPPTTDPDTPGNNPGGDTGDDNPTASDGISYTYAGEECAAFEWKESNAAGASVQYKLSSASSYTDVDSQLVRAKTSSVARVDVVGLKGGATYDFKITDSTGKSMTVTGMKVEAYDRSGYAHFGKSGVGAYNDDGTPKSGAKIIYLTEENKNNIDGNGTSIAEYLKSFKSKKNTTPIIIRVVGTVGSATWNKKTYSGYGKDKPLTAAEFVKNTKGNGTLTLTTSSKTDYTQTQLINGGFNTLNEKPAAYNGATCKAINGLNSKISCKSDSKLGWVYDSCWNDCLVENVENVTVEGIGEDAEIFQWGFTFKNSSSVEVRNIHFDDYTEDACSFEGSESGATSLSGFKSGNVWIHHNTFDEGMNYWDVCDEQDKVDGDGSTDFKGIKNITIAFNHYIETHKTNLIGGGDGHATANVTFHHNYYESCNQRMPLGRQANMHMYNNYYSGTTFYSISLRAGAYAFIENCAFTEDTSKHYPLELVDSGDYGKGAAKIINCDISSSKIQNGSGSAYLYVGTDRTATVDNTDQRFAKNFDTDATKFYYKNGKSDVEEMLTAAQVKTEIPKVAGVQKHVASLGGGTVVGGTSGDSGNAGNTGNTDTTTPGGDSGNTGDSGTTTPETPVTEISESANVTGAKTEGTVLLELKNGSATVAKATLIPAAAEKSGGTLEESDGTTQKAEGHVQLDATGAVKLELAEGYTYTVTIYTGSSSNDVAREITINGVKQTTGIGAVCKALTWNLNADTFNSTETGKIRIAKIVITATPV